MDLIRFHLECDARCPAKAENEFYTQDGKYLQFCQHHTNKVMEVVCNGDLLRNRRKARKLSPPKAMARPSRR